MQETAHILKEKMAQTQIDSVVNIKPIIEIPEPPMFKVIYINDELTSMEFVVRTLVNHFNYTRI